MAPRHAGFAAVTCVTEDLVNSLLGSAFAHQLPPLAFTFPTPIPVFQHSVTIIGEASVLAPRVTFTPNPANLVGVRCRFTSDVRLIGPTGTPVDVALDLGCTVNVGLRVDIVDGQFRVGLDMSQAAVQALDIVVKAGRGISSTHGRALKSGPVLSALTTALKAIPQHLLFTTLNGVPVTTHIAPREMPCGASLFELPEMFHASFSVSRVVPRVLNRELALGIDVDGHTRGDPNQLGSLFNYQPQLKIFTTGIEGPVEERIVTARGVGNFAGSVNPEFVGSFLEDTLTPALNNAFMDCHVALEAVSVSYGRFTPPLTRDHIDGVTLRVRLRHHTSPGRDAQSRLTPGGISIPVEFSVPLAVHLQTFDGPTAFVSRFRDYWFLKVYPADADLPWWVTAGLILSGVVVRALVFPVVVVLADILPAMLANAANEIAQTIRGGIRGGSSSLGLSGAVSQPVKLAFAPNTPTYVGVPLISFTGGGFDVFTRWSLDTSEDTRPDRLIVVTVGGASRVRDGDTLLCSPSPLRQIRLAAALKSGVVSPADTTVMVRWRVRRLDTNELLIDQVLPYYPSPSSDAMEDDSVAYDGSPALAVLARRVVIDRTDSVLRTVADFGLHVRVYRQLAGSVREFGSSRFTIRIEDRLDRRHPYVRWGSTAPWGEPRQSAIHRTAIPGRCLMVTRAHRKAQFEYLDELPFPIDLALQHRDQLCDYCFFGGPDKSTLLI